MRSRFTVTGLVLALLFAVMLLSPKVSQSVPSFARQTGLSCTNCHTVFPELNSFGRLFKLNGYTLSSDESIESKGPDDKSNLKLPKVPPFSAMVQASLTHLNKAIPGSQNGNTAFPQEFGFFFAGQISPHIGGFAQVTWDDASSAFDFDALDFRFSSKATLNQHDLIYGLTLNNNPTLQDVWNSTPFWSFPYATSAVAPSPGAAPRIASLESLEQSYAGLGVYGFYNNMIYGEFSVYHHTPRGESPNPPNAESNNVFRKVAPYWRVALQHQWPSQYLEVGTFGLTARYYPAGISGLTNKFTDIGFDAQSMTDIGPGALTAHATYIHEKQDFDASYPDAAQNLSNKLNLFKIDANYYFKKKYGVAVGIFGVTGDADTLQYPAEPVSGYSAGKPNSNGVIFELDYLPWLNTKFSLQYVAYSKFNGAGTNYDGSGRNASDNNTLYLLTWLAM